MTEVPAAPVGGIHAKIAHVLGAVERIPKNGWNDHFNYAFTREADVVSTVRKLLAEQQVALYVSNRLVQRVPIKTSKGKDTYLVDVEVTMEFVDASDGSSHKIYGSGTGEDPGDKGTYKGITGAVKYALLKQFLIDTGDDPENPDQGGAPARPAAGPSGSPGKITDKQMKFLWAKAHELFDVLDTGPYESGANVADVALHDCIEAMKGQRTMDALTKADMDTLLATMDRYAADPVGCMAQLAELRVQRTDAAGKEA